VNASRAPREEPGRGGGRALDWLRLCRVGVACGVLACTPTPSAIADDDLGAARQRELEYMLMHDCGACHGLTLRGGLGPSLLPEALGGQTVDALAWTIREGRPGTAMPPWKPFLSVEEAQWLATFLLEGRSAKP